MKRQWKQLLGRAELVKMRRIRYGCLCQILRDKQRLRIVSRRFRLLNRLIDRIRNHEWIMRTFTRFEIRRWYRDEVRGIMRFRPKW